MPFRAEGVIPACLMPFDSERHIDREAYCSHLRDLANVDGISAITVNGHAAEVHALSFEEQREALELACETLEGAVPIVAGVSTSNFRDASRLARMATESGADAVLVFPSDVLALGGQARPETALAHVTSIAESTDLPLILFQYPLSSGLGYPLETLLMLCEQVPSIVAIKDWCHDPPLHERHIRELHALDRPVRVLTTHSAWLLGSLAMGADGLLSGAGSVIASLHVALWQAIQQGDLIRARQVNDAIYPTVRAFYRDPLLDMHNRMKEALVILGRLREAHVRPPLVQLTEHERHELKQRLQEAGLLSKTMSR